jgi:lysophospholipase L1-like esterase
MRTLIIILTAVTWIGQANADFVPGSKDLGPIWIIGDSITQGNADGNAAGSYRASLYSLLSAGGYNFSFTGHSSADFGGLPVGYRYHSGVSGAVIQNNYNGRTGIQQSIGAWWNQGELATSKPNAILLMIGTNDINLNYNAATAPNRLSSLIASLYNLAGDDVSMFVASIPPQSTSSAVTTFNAAIPGIVSSYKNAGKKIYFADAYSAINASYSLMMNGDNLHPNAAGNEAIAGTFYDAIEAVTAPEPSTLALMTTGLIALAACARRKR